MGTHRGGGSMKHEMQIDWQGIISLLANHLYSDKRIFIREIVQNANDAIMKRRAVDPSYAGRVNIAIDRDLGIIRFEDDGLGMDESDLIEFLACVGRGQSSQARDDLPGVIGQFGIGFLSAFVVANSVEVQTRKLNSSRAWKWK
jgi:molecular chaperone HtpG